jgi:Flp pilus assembly protein TadG
MMPRHSLIGNRSGSAAAEMALVLPLLLILMMGSVELGNYFYNEHKLVKSVRDGARYAARQRFVNYTACTGAPTDPVPADTELMVRKGTLDSTAPDLLANWDDADFQMSVTCTATVDDADGTYDVAGIYANSAGGAPTVLVSVELPYRPLLATPFGFSGSGMSLNASQSAAVAGL